MAAVSTTQQPAADQRWWAREPPWLVKFAAELLVAGVLLAVLGALFGAWVTDTYSDRQREIELEAQLITTVSSDALTLYQEAQEAARAPGGPEQLALRDAAADNWSAASNGTIALMEIYYPGTAAQEHFGQYQSAMYDWAVLGCCTTEARGEVVRRVREYVETRLDPGGREPPVADPWGALEASADPPDDVYQWAGLQLLRGRGAVLSELREARPTLD